MGEFAGNSLSKIAIVLIAVGATITLVSLLGHLGAFFNNSNMVSCVSNMFVLSVFKGKSNGSNAQSVSLVHLYPDHHHHYGGHHRGLLLRSAQQGETLTFRDQV